MTKKESEHTKSCGNLFKDIGFSDEDAEELMGRTKLLLEINKIANKKELPIKYLSAVLNIKTSEAVDIRKGRAHKLTNSVLKKHLTHLISNN